MEGIKGYKVFNPDWTCRDFKYEVGNTYEEDVDPSVCDRGFHFCKLPKDCFNYYSFNSDNKVAEVVALGEVSEEGDKYATNKIKIIREISWQEVLTLVNTGKDCTGHSNSGHRNSGNRNSGNWNSGNWNSDHSNSGHSNSGDSNSGDSNSGDANNTVVVVKETSTLSSVTIVGSTAVVSTAGSETGIGATVGPVFECIEDLQAWIGGNR